jgi:hypothetical protein
MDEQQGNRPRWDRALDRREAASRYPLRVAIGSRALPIAPGRHRPGWRVVACGCIAVARRERGAAKPCAVTRRFAGIGLIGTAQICLWLMAALILPWGCLAPLAAQTANRQIEDQIRSLSIPAERFEAADRLRAYSALPVLQLIAALQVAEDDSTRRSIAEVLGRIGAPAVEALIRTLRAAQDEETRRWIVYALDRIGLPAAPAVDALLAAFKASQNEFTGQWIAYALGRIGTPAAVDALIEVLKTARTNDTRLRIAEALTRIGAPARDALVAALKATQNEDMRGWIAWVLDRIGAPPAPAKGEGADPR